MVRDAAWPGSDPQSWGTPPAAGLMGRLSRPSAPDPWGVVCYCPSLGRPWCARVCDVLGHLAPVHRCACSVCCVPSAVSWATCLLFTAVPARCPVLRVRCPGPLSSCSWVCSLGVLPCVCGVLGHLAPVHRCVCSVPCPVRAASWATCSCSPVCALGVLCCVGCAASWATWLLFSHVRARCVVLCCMCGVLGHLVPVHPCARSVCCLACAVSWATWLLFSHVRARCVVLCCMCGVLGHLVPVHPCARSVCCLACALSWATWLLFIVVPPPCAALCVRYPGPLGPCSLEWQLPLSCRVCGVLGLLAPVCRCALSVRCVVCAVSSATWLWFSSVPARCVVSRVQCPGPPGSCSPVCPSGVLSCVCGVLGQLAPVHRCAR